MSKAENKQIDILVGMVREMRDDLREHYKIDADAWKLVNRHEGVIRTVKVALTLLAAGNLTALFAYLKG